MKIPQILKTLVEFFKTHPAHTHLKVRFLAKNSTSVSMLPRDLSRTKLLCPIKVEDTRRVFNRFAPNLTSSFDELAKPGDTRRVFDPHAILCSFLKPRF